MTREQVMITNKLGLHARAAAKLVHTASAFEAEIYIGTEHEEVNAKSILGILTLAATKGTPLIVRADGVDEKAAVEAIAALFADKFGEGQ
jgi:phosphocarrier protein